MVLGCNLWKYSFDPENYFTKESNTVQECDRPYFTEIKKKNLKSNNRRKLKIIFFINEIKDKRLVSIQQSEQGLTSSL